MFPPDNLVPGQLINPCTGQLESPIAPGTLSPTLLHGHTSEATAYLVTDYPYAQHRTHKKYWLEMKKSVGKNGGGKGAAYVGKMRVASRTLRPPASSYPDENACSLGTHWNAVHHSVYSELIFLYRDENNHCQSFPINPYPTPILHFFASGLYHQMIPAQQSHFTRVFEYAQRAAPKSFEQLRLLLSISRKYLTARLEQTADLSPESLQIIRNGISYDYQMLPFNVTDLEYERVLQAVLLEHASGVKISGWWDRLQLASR